MPTWGTALELRWDLPALIAVVLLSVGFTFSNNAVEFALDVTEHADLAATHRQWLVMGLYLQLQS